MKQGRSSFNEAAGDPQSSPYRWVMLAMLWFLYAFFGIAYRSISPLVTPILADLNMSYSQMGFVLGSWQLTYIGASTVAGFFIDRWGIRWSLFFGTLIIALSVGLALFRRRLWPIPRHGRPFWRWRPHDLYRLSQDHCPLVSRKGSGNRSGHILHRTVFRRGFGSHCNEQSRSCPLQDIAGD